MNEHEHGLRRAREVPCTVCGAPAWEAVNEHERARCHSCARRRAGEILALAREITFATRQPAHNEADDVLGIDHGYHAAADAGSDGALDLIEDALADLDLSPGEQADLIWAVVDYQHQSVDELRAWALVVSDPDGEAARRWWRNDS